MPYHLNEADAFNCVDCLMDILCEIQAPQSEKKKKRKLGFVEYNIK